MEMIITLCITLCKNYAENYFMFMFSFLILRELVERSETMQSFALQRGFIGAAAPIREHKK